MDFKDRLATAKARPRPHKDVPVCLDDELAAKRDELLDALTEAEQADAQDARLAAKKDEHVAPIREALDALAEAAQDALVTVRFTRLPGDAWAGLTSRNPVRIDVPIDRHYGYNYDAVCLAAAMWRTEDDPETAYAHRVEGDEVFPLEPAEVADLFELVSGHEVSEMRDAIWSLNEYDPQQRITALVKGYGAAARSETK